MLALMVLDLSDERIKELLGVRKTVVSSEKTSKYLHEGVDLVLKGDDGETYKVYTRQSQRIQDAFSCGIRWCPKGEEEVTLMRVNGSDHLHPNSMERTKIDRKCHVHRATERYIRQGRKPETFAEESTEYTTLDGAISLLGREANIEGEPFTAPQKPLFK